MQIKLSTLKRTTRFLGLILIVQMFFSGRPSAHKDIEHKTVSEANKVVSALAETKN
ncbi:MAG: hypothetical protein KatS3mg031_1939 [Chitinophagales bacterium]|nr:MAG: hypothetical protein KatS3mg031_1939 [Chitinophagales bacterium]